MRPYADQTILGLQIAVTSGAAIMHRGHVVFAASEERFTRVKNETAFPERATEAALGWIDTQGIPRPHLAVLLTENMDFNHYATRRECTFSVADYLREQREIWRPRLIEGRDADYAAVFADRYDPRALDHRTLDRLRRASDPKRTWHDVRDEMARDLPGIEETIWVGHEHAHAAYALYGSGVAAEDALIVTMDGFGDDANATVWVHDDGRLRRIASYRDFNVGRLYRAMTLLLGMKPNEHEYKVMGLAPHARDPWAEAAYRVFAETWHFDDRSGEISARVRPKDCYYHFRDRLEGMRFDAIAGGLQRYTEEMITSLVRHWVRRTGRPHVVLSGGVALNVKANLAVSELPEVASVRVPPSPGDESLGIGGLYALLDGSGEGAATEPLTHAWLGTEYDQDAIDAATRSFARDHGDFAARDRVPATTIARLLAAGYVVARFSGRMEFGARSLGNRAILASPADVDVVRRINATIKQRDFWMSFTPSILAEDTDRFLVGADPATHGFMTLACRTTAAARRSIPATLHQADFTARPQIVSAATSPEFRELLRAFRELTGIGALLNTSLNLSGLPICESPADVLHVLEHSQLDAAWLGTTLVHRRGAGLEELLASEQDRVLTMV